ncbi:glycoside hydrolase family 75 protein [Streptomyces sp. NPDC058280]|uniref:glycoside hydrolase family 75 protein n=1 Tax=Streptomyces sp. NPDC058280 TaxID=3346419 RepID=UPI0036E58474
MQTRTHVVIAVGAALVAAAALPAIVLPALAEPSHVLEPPYAAPSPAPPAGAPPYTAPAPAPPSPAPSARQGAPGPPAGQRAAGRGGPAQNYEVSAADLLAKASRCNQISQGMYRLDEGSPGTVPVCDANGAVFWQADMDIDCDGQSTSGCNGATDRTFQTTTAYTQSDGQPLNSEELPYIVVPNASSIWNFSSSGIRGGSVAAVIHGEKVEYAVVGDTGPPGIIGEASYGMARALGIPSDPDRGGAGEGVTYILFKDSQISTLEDRAATVQQGKELARRFVEEN